MAALVTFLYINPAVTDFISFKMGYSPYHAEFHMLSWILTRLFKKKVTVTGVKRDYYVDNAADGHINIRFDALLATEQELFYKVLRIIRQTLAQGRFVVDSVFGHANVEDGEENYILSENPSDSPVKEVTVDNPPFEWNDELPFEWSCCLLEEETEESFLCVEECDDGSIAPVFTLKYSIAMDDKVCFDDDAPENSAHLEQLREDIETLWGKNTQQTYNFYNQLQDWGPYETDLYLSGQDIFISASIVRAFKEKEDLCTGFVESMEKGYYYS